MIAPMLRISGPARPAELRHRRIARQRRRLAHVAVRCRRTGLTTERLDGQLHLRWVREYPPLRPAFFQARQERVQCDAGYEPIVMGKRLFVRLQPR